jgi:hypothetical protein
MQIQVPWLAVSKDMQIFFRAIHFITHSARITICLESSKQKPVITSMH